MSEPRWTPVIGRLSAWLGPDGDPAAADDDPRDSAYLEVTGIAARLELRDLRLTEARTALITAAELVRDTVARHRPQASGPAAAVELDLLAERLAGLGEPYPGGDGDPALLRRAALMCAGEEWARLSGLLPALKVRVMAVTDGIAENAVRSARLTRVQRSSWPTRSAAYDAVEAEELAVAAELRRRTAKAGADAAYAAADGVFLPSLADFLR